MTIQITVIDPANTSRAELLQVVALLTHYADGHAHIFSPSAVAPLPPSAVLEAADNPAAGLDMGTPTAAFGDPLATEAFGAATGNAVVAGPLSTPPVGTPPAPPNGAQTAGVNIQGVELDATGLPWDNRIHAGTKTKKADGTWTAKRGVDQALVTSVTAELRGLMAIPSPGNVPTGAPVTPPAPVMTPPPPPAPTTAQSVPAFTPPAPVGAPSLPVGIDFSTLAAKVAEWVGAGRLSQDQLTGIVATKGVPSFGLLFNRPDLVPAVHAELTAIVGA